MTTVTSVTATPVTSPGFSHRKLNSNFVTEAVSTQAKIVGSWTSTASNSRNISQRTPTLTQRQIEQKRKDVEAVERVEQSLAWHEVWVGYGKRAGFPPSQRPDMQVLLYKTFHKTSETTTPKPKPDLCTIL